MPEGPTALTRLSYHRKEISFVRLLVLNTFGFTIAKDIPYEFVAELRFDKEPLHNWNKKET